jgi:hypothetical protein
MALQRTELEICKLIAVFRQVSKRDRHLKLKRCQSTALLRQISERYRYLKIEGYKSVTLLKQRGIIRRHRQIKKNYY